MDNEQKRNGETTPISETTIEFSHLLDGVNIDHSEKSIPSRLHVLAELDAISGMSGDGIYEETSNRHTGRFLRSKTKCILKHVKVLTSEQIMESARKDRYYAFHDTTRRTLPPHRDNETVQTLTLDKEGIIGKEFTMNSRDRMTISSITLNLKDNSKRTAWCKVTSDGILRRRSSASGKQGVNPWEHPDMYREFDASMIESSFMRKRSLTRTQTTPTKRAEDKRPTTHKFIRIERAEPGLTVGIRFNIQPTRDNKTGQETTIAVVNEMTRTNDDMGSAEKAGLKIGDEITHINHICIESKGSDEINDIIQASPQNFLMYIRRHVTPQEKSGKESQQHNKQSKTQQGHIQDRGDDQTERETRA